MADKEQATHPIRGVNPTPWRVAPGRQDEAGQQVAYALIDADGVTVATGIVNELTAQRIVRAVNAYRPRRFL